MWKEFLELMESYRSVVVAINVQYILSITLSNHDEIIISFFIMYPISAPLLMGDRSSHGDRSLFAIGFVKEIDGTTKCGIITA